MVYFLGERTVIGDFTLSLIPPLFNLLSCSHSSITPLHLSSLDLSVTDRSSPDVLVPDSGFLAVDQVRRDLRQLKNRKTAGPDNSSPRLLRDCADQLCEMVTYIFNLSLSLQKVPDLWKTSRVVPVPKTIHAKELNQYRPADLTSHLMKTMEKLDPPIFAPW